MFIVNFVLSFLDNPISIFPQCQLEDGSFENSCGQQIITNLGICYAFNSPEWNRSTSSFYNVRPVLRQGKDAYTIGFDSNLVVGANLGVDIPTFSIDDMFKYMQDYSYALYVSDPLNAVSVPSHVRWVNLLQLTELNIEAQAMSTIEGTNEFVNMNINRRKCYYPHEFQLEKFDYYSQDNCFLECAWNHAMTKCKCIPWYLYQYYPNEIICEKIGLKCFSNIINQRKMISQQKYAAITETASWRLNCSSVCLQDCERVKYDIWEVSSKNEYNQLNTNQKHDWLTVNFTKYYKKMIEQSWEMDLARNFREK